MFHAKRNDSATELSACDIRIGCCRCAWETQNDDDEDYSIPVWAGVVPLKLTPGVPIPDPRLDSALENEIPEYILPYQRPVEMAP